MNKIQYPTWFYKLNISTKPPNTLINLEMIFGELSRAEYFTCLKEDYLDIDYRRTYILCIPNTNIFAFHQSIHWNCWSRLWNLKQTSNSKDKFINRVGSSFSEAKFWVKSWKASIKYVDVYTTQNRQEHILLQFTNV